MSATTAESLVTHRIGVLRNMAILSPLARPWSGSVLSLLLWTLQPPLQHPVICWPISSSAFSFFSSGRHRLLDIHLLLLPLAFRPLPLHQVHLPYMLLLVILG